MTLDLDLNLDGCRFHKFNSNGRAGRVDLNPDTGNTSNRQKCEKSVRRKGLRRIQTCDDGRGMPIRKFRPWHIVMRVYHSYGQQFRINYGYCFRCEIGLQTNGRLVSETLKQDNFKNLQQKQFLTIYFSSIYLIILQKLPQPVETRFSKSFLQLDCGLLT